MNNKMNQDLTLLLAIEQLVQEKMIIHQGMLVANDIELAKIFELDVQDLREEVRKSLERFPSDFMVQLGDGEYAFTEPGIIMLGGLLKSERAIRVHLQFIEYFIRLAHESGVSIFDIIESNRNEL
ncbi:MAG: ORF6N domain-containing protein [Bacteroidales bacterium]